MLNAERVTHSFVAQSYIPIGLSDVDFKRSEIYQLIANLAAFRLSVLQENVSRAAKNKCEDVE